MPKPQPFLSKTKYLDGLKCDKLLWYDFNNSSAIPKPDAMTQAVFDQGHRVGEWAQKLFPDGIKVERLWQPELMHERSLKALKLRKPIFEAGLIFGRTYALPDILVPVEDDQWDLIEVKSGTNVEEEHLIDVAYQNYVYTGAGLKIRRTYLMHINNRYVRQGAIEPEKLFIKEDITEEIREHRPGLERSIRKMLAVITGNEPKVKIGPYCNSPHTCPLKETCWGFLPDDHIFQLRGRKGHLFDLIEQGIHRITDLPLDDLNEKQLLQIKSHRSGEPHIDKDEIKDFLRQIKYPIYFLDFESIAPAIPIYDQTSPYEAIPFQFSLHIIKSKGAEPEHHSYLAPGNIDPRPEVLKRLKVLLGDTSTILAYNMAFEIGCLKRSAAAHQEYQSWVDALEDRFVDLIAPFKGLHYYHPTQGGSASIKSVLPAMTGTSYDGLEIGEGQMANREYERVTFDANIDEADRRRVRQALETYCRLDTQAMVDIFRELSKLSA